MNPPLPHRGVGQAPHVKWGAGGSLRTGWGDHGRVTASSSSGQCQSMKWQLSPRLLVLPALAALVALVGLRLWHSHEPITEAPDLPPHAFQWLHGLAANTTTLPTRHPLRPPYPHPYRFLLNQPHKCRDQAPFLVLLVATAPEDTGARHCIRRTWGNESAVPGTPILRLFLLGLHPVFADALEPVLREESREYGDLIQQDFMDTYNNLTLKTLMGLQWGLLRHRLRVPEHGPDPEQGLQVVRAAGAVPQHHLPPVLRRSRLRPVHRRGLPRARRGADPAPHQHGGRLRGAVSPCPGHHRHRRPVGRVLYGAHPL
ncbi:lactosylceramide 1,3-N-acetyl-beta-D-glucosaminyltransferase-like isoform X3 [Melopsittacus undulatus]|uniref:lactosylceramide 1,3-N-acetyl-beta-D-glucosaminyltransferase-like isoform X3 n=1 Tax=Melopsittacus undulatus TaxID=13146 RepID=UPI00146B7589|nr:lactosylceramide 1,3-N-acetyl-beta-D-glucosaminyltransferase-like isoform X3 [Melopsittacus undulatus]